MGYFAHHTIVVTSWEPEAEKLRQKAIEIIGPELVSNLIVAKTNGYKSFFVAPDGSKEGWETSNEYNDKREAFCEWLETEGDRTLCPYHEYILVRFGGDEPYLAKIERSDYPASLDEE